MQFFFCQYLRQQECRYYTKGKNMQKRTPRKGFHIFYINIEPH